MLLSIWKIFRIRMIDPASLLYAILWTLKSVCYCYSEIPWFCQTCGTCKVMLVEHVVKQEWNSNGVIDSVICTGIHYIAGRIINVIYNITVYFVCVSPAQMEWQVLEESFWNCIVGIGKECCTYCCSITQNVLDRWFHFKPQSNLGRRCGNCACSYERILPCRIQWNRVLPFIRRPAEFTHSGKQFFKPVYPACDVLCISAYTICSCIYSLCLETDGQENDYWGGDEGQPDKILIF